MKTSSKQLQQLFIHSEAAVELREELMAMENDPTFHTVGTYMPSLKSEISICKYHLVAGPGSAAWLRCTEPDFASQNYPGLRLGRTKKKEPHKGDSLFLVAGPGLEPGTSWL
jgi:hypothetical protein